MCDADEWSEAAVLHRLYEKAFGQYWMMVWCHRGYDTYVPFYDELNAAMELWKHCIPTIGETYADGYPSASTKSSAPNLTKGEQERCLKFRVLTEIDLAFQLLIVGSDALGLVSSNDQLADIHTENIKFLMLPYVSSHVALEKPDMEQRLNILKRCVVYLHEFVNVLIRLEFLKPREYVYWDRNLNDLPNERRTFRVASTKYSLEILSALRPILATAGTIEKFLREASSKSKDEETARENLLRLLHLFSFEAINLYDMAQVEIPLLERRLSGIPPKKEPPPPPWRPSSKKSAKGKPWFIRVDGLTKLDPTTVHFLYRQLIFVPGHKLPNITLKECARIEMEMDVNTIGVKGSQEGKEVGKGKEKDKESDQDTDDGRSDASDPGDSGNDTDVAKEEAKWDDWKDDHPRGSGNKNRNVG